MEKRAAGCVVCAVSALMVATAEIRLINDKLFFDKHVMRRMAAAFALDVMAALLWIL